MTFTKRTHLLFTLFIAGFLIMGCGSEGDDSSNNSSSADTSSLNATLRGSNVGSTGVSSSNTKLGGPDFVTAPTTTADPVSCNAFFVLGDKAANGNQCNGSIPCYPDAGQRSGSCLTPISITGKASQGDLLGSNTPGGLRLLGSSIEGGGKDDIYLTGEAFDMANPVTLSGENNLEDHSDFDSQHTSIRLSFDYLDVKVAVPRTAGTKFWTIRYIFFSSPFTSDTNYSCTTSCTDSAELDCSTTCTATSETIGQCLEANHHSEASDSADTIAVTHMDSLTGVKIGDILLCQKDSATATCSTSDWQWLDKSLNSNTGGFVSTRPSTESNIWKFNHIADHKPTCEADSSGQGMNMNLGGWAFTADLYTPISFTATHKNALKVYSFQDSSGSKQEGSNLEMYLDIDMKNSVILYDEENSGATSLAFADLGSSFATLKNLSDASLFRKMWYKPIFAYEFSGCDPWKPGECENIPNGVKANLTIALSGATEPPIYDCESEKGSSSTECVGKEPTGSQ